MIVCHKAHYNMVSPLTGGNQTAGGSPKTFWTEESDRQPNPKLLYRLPQRGPIKLGNGKMLECVHSSVWIDNLNNGTIKAYRLGSELDRNSASLFVVQQHTQNRGVSQICWPTSLIILIKKDCPENKEQAIIRCN